MLTKGTLADKISALSLLIQRDTEATHSYFQTLLNIVSAFSTVGQQQVEAKGPVKHQCVEGAVR